MKVRKEKYGGARRSGKIMEWEGSGFSILDP